MVEFCSLYSGSSGNSLFVKNNDTRILIDAGVSTRKITTALNEIGESAEKIDAVLISHEHKDHIQGIKVFFKKYGVPVYANAKTWGEIEKYTQDIIPDSEKRYFTTNEEFKIKDLTIKTFPISHDAVEPVGFNLFADDKKITTATDLGYISKEVMTALDASDLLFIESNHDKEMLKMGIYPWYLKQRILSKEGHLSNDVAGKAIAYFANRGTKKFILGHLSKNNNFPELAYQTVKNILESHEISITDDISLSIASQDNVGEMNYI